MVHVQEGMLTQGNTTDKQEVIKHKAYLIN